MIHNQQSENSFDKSNSNESEEDEDDDDTSMIVNANLQKVSDKDLLMYNKLFEGGVVDLADQGIEF